MKPSRPARLLPPLLLILVAAASVRNVFADAGAVEAQARAAACAGRGPRCNPLLTRLLRTPLFHDLQFREGGASVDVRCQRAFYLVGDYDCRIRR